MRIGTGVKKNSWHHNCRSQKLSLAKIHSVILEWSWYNARFRFMANIFTKSHFLQDKWLCFYIHGLIGG